MKAVMLLTINAVSSIRSDVPVNHSPACVFICFPCIKASESFKNSHLKERLSLSVITHSDCSCSDALSEYVRLTAHLVLYSFPIDFKCLSILL